MWVRSQELAPLQLCPQWALSARCTHPDSTQAIPVSLPVKQGQPRSGHHICAGGRSQTGQRGKRRACPARAPGLEAPREGMGLGLCAPRARPEGCLAKEAVPRVGLRRAGVNTPPCSSRSSGLPTPAPPLPLPLSAGPGADGSAPAAQPRVLPNRPSPRVPPLSSGQSRVYYGESLNKMYRRL